MNQFFKNIAKDYRPSSPCKVPRSPETKSFQLSMASPRRKFTKKGENSPSKKKRTFEMLASSTNKMEEQAAGPALQNSQTLPYCGQKPKVTEKGVRQRVSATDTPQVREKLPRKHISDLDKVNYNDSKAVIPIPVKKRISDCSHQIHKPPRFIHKPENTDSVTNRMKRKHPQCRKRSPHPEESKVNTPVGSLKYSSVDSRDRSASRKKRTNKNYSNFRRITTVPFEAESFEGKLFSGYGTPLSTPQNLPRLQNFRQGDQFNSSKLSPHKICESFKLEVIPSGGPDGKGASEEKTYEPRIEMFAGKHRGTLDSDLTSENYSILPSHSSAKSSEDRHPAGIVVEHPEDGTALNISIEKVDQAKATLKAGEDLPSLRLDLSSSHEEGAATSSNFQMSLQQATSKTRLALDHEKRRSSILSKRMAVSQKKVAKVTVKKQMPDLLTGKPDQQAKASKPNKMCWKAQRTLLQYKIYKEENQRLRRALKMTKTFMNMVIHDLRSPCSQIKYTIEEALQQFQIIQQQRLIIDEDYSKFSQIKEMIVLRSKSFSDHLQEVAEHNDELMATLQEQRAQIENLQFELGQKQNEIEELKLNKNLTPAQAEVCSCNCGRSPLPQILKTSCESEEQAALLADIEQFGKLEQYIKACSAKMEDLNPRDTMIKDDFLDLVSRQMRAKQTKNLALEQARLKNQIKRITIKLSQQNVAKTLEFAHEDDFGQDDRSPIVNTEVGPRRKSRKSIATKAKSATIQKDELVEKLRKVAQDELSSSLSDPSDHSSSNQANADIDSDNDLGTSPQGHSILSKSFPMLTNDLSRFIKDIPPAGAESESKQITPLLKNLNGISGDDEDEGSSHSLISDEDEEEEQKTPKEPGYLSVPKEAKDSANDKSRIRSPVKIERYVSFSSQAVVGGSQAHQQKSRQRFLSMQNDLEALYTMWDEAQNNFIENREIITSMIFKGQDNLQLCKHSSLMLLNLINDLLDLAKQEKLTFSFNNSFFNLISTVNTTFKVLGFLSKQKNITTVINVDEDESCNFRQVYSDSNRFEQILLNFVSNALKFTNDHGRVEVRLKTKEVSMYDYKKKGSLSKRSSGFIIEGNSEGEVVYNQFTIEIIDNGQGISEEGLSKLFIDFSRLSEHSKSNQRGTGLGLSICKQIIEKMGGKVTVTSQVGVGTTFTIELTMPVKVCTQSEYENLRNPDSLSEKMFFMNQDQLSSGSSSNKDSVTNQSMKKTFAKSKFACLKDSEGSDLTSSEDDTGKERKADPQLEVDDSSSMSSSDPKFQLRLRGSSDEAQTPELEKPMKQEPFFDNLLQTEKNRCSSFKTVGRGTSNIRNKSSSFAKQRINLFQTTEESKNAFDSQASTQNQAPLPAFNTTQTSHQGKSFKGGDSSFKVAKKESSAFMTPQEIAKDSDDLSGNDAPSATSQEAAHLTDMIMMDRPRRRRALTKADGRRQRFSTFKSKSVLLDSLDPSEKQSPVNVDKAFDEQSALTPEPLNALLLKQNKQKEMSVLIVNDELLTVMILEQLFKSKIQIRPENIQHANNGLEAYQKAISSNFDLIILDLNMPVMNGFESCRKIKEYYEKSTNVLCGGLIYDSDDSPQPRKSKEQQHYQRRLVGTEVATPADTMSPALNNTDNNRVDSSKDLSFYKLPLPETRRAPHVIALSASNYDEELLEKMKEAKFDDWFTSPLEAAKIQTDVIDLILKKNYPLLFEMLEEEA